MRGRSFVEHVETEMIANKSGKKAGEEHENKIVIVG